MALFRRFERRNVALQASDFGEQSLRGGFLIAFLRGADLLGGEITPRLCGLRRLNCGAALLI